VTTGAEGAVGLEHDAPLLARLEEPPAKLEGAELHLIDDGRGAGDREQLLELAGAEVGDAD
jgi:hypothetical protein